MTAQEREDREKTRKNKNRSRRFMNEQWDEIYKIIESDGFVNCGSWEVRKRTDFMKDPT